MRAQLTTENITAVDDIFFFFSARMFSGAASALSDGLLLMKRDRVAATRLRISARRYLSNTRI